MPEQDSCIEGGNCVPILDCPQLIILLPKVQGSVNMGFISILNLENVMLVSYVILVILHNNQTLITKIKNDIKLK